MDLLNIAVLASGRGSNFQSIQDAIEAGKIKARIVLLVTDRKDAPAVERAHRHGIESLFLDPTEFEAREAYDGAIASALKKRSVGLVVLAGFMRVVTRSLIRPFKDRIMNIHPALLPAFPGLHGQRDACAYGVKIAGCTVHFVDEGVDTGPIILQGAVPAYDDDTEESLAARILRVEHRIYPKAVKLFADKRLTVEGRIVRIKRQSHRDDDLLLAMP